MKLGSFLRVEPLVHRRNHLMDLREARVEVSLAGQYQNRDFVDEVTPAIRLALRRQIEDIDAELRRLGVDIG